MLDSDSAQISTKRDSGKRNLRVLRALSHEISPVRPIHLHYPYLTLQKKIATRKDSLEKLSSPDSPRIHNKISEIPRVRNRRMNSRLPPSREIPILPQIIHRIHPSKIENAGRSHLTESPGLRDRRRAASTSGDRAEPRRAASNPAPGRVSSAASTPPRESRRRGGDADAFVSRPPRRFQIWGGCFEINPTAA